MMSRFESANKKTLKSFWQLTPVLLGVLLLASMMVEIIPMLISKGVLGHGLWQDALLANIIGSASTGQPIISYVLAGELQRAGIALLPVTVFIVSWVTVGVISLPAEAVALGWRFSILRNILAFFMAFILGWLTVVSINVF
ncbi:hypothetical protein MNBD_GAMMA09-3650 [hydrothermal vent metagenome]|uniref:Permease n=1 Tax=hydrothermal vent metagenome TaxID=652676 RepID=A0A3B0XJD9_9ZZZZ